LVIERLIISVRRLQCAQRFMNQSKFLLRDGFWRVRGCKLQNSHVCAAPVRVNVVRHERCDEHRSLPFSLPHDHEIFEILAQRERR